MFASGPEWFLHFCLWLLVKNVLVALPLLQKVKYQPEAFLSHSYECLKYSWCRFRFGKQSNWLLLSAQTPTNSCQFRISRQELWPRGTKSSVTEERPSWPEAKFTLGPKVTAMALKQIFHSQKPIPLAEIHKRANSGDPPTTPDPSLPPQPATKKNLHTFVRYSDS